MEEPLHKGKAKPIMIPIQGHKLYLRNLLKFLKNSLQKQSPNLWYLATKTFSKPRFRSRDPLKSIWFKSHGRTKTLSERKNNLKYKFCCLAKSENLSPKFNKLHNLCWKAKTFKFKFLYKAKIRTETFMERLRPWLTIRTLANPIMHFFCHPKRLLTNRSSR